MNEQQQQILQVYLQEYEKLKDEQTQRIGFRDNLIYVTLGIFGGILSFALSNKTNYYALLVIPWVCLILGWTYLVNDEKISALGEYIRLTLAPKVMQLINNPQGETFFAWEIAHRSDERRTKRKIKQLIVDEITFVLSGIIVVFYFWFSSSSHFLAINLICGVELLLLLVLGVEIFLYADLAKEQ